jgi:hypothetical protein
MKTHFSLASAPRRNRAAPGRHSLFQNGILRNWSKNHFSLLKSTYLNPITVITQIPSMYMDRKHLFQPQKHLIQLNFKIKAHLS